MYSKFLCKILNKKKDIINFNIYLLCNVRLIVAKSILEHIIYQKR